MITNAESEFPRVLLIFVINKLWNKNRIQTWANLAEHDASSNKTCLGSHHSHSIHPVNFMVCFKARLHMRFLSKKLEEAVLVN